MGKIFYIMGKSSSGKDTLYRSLRIEFPQLKPVVPYTTRPVRKGEIEGVDYYFVNNETVEALQSEGRIIEIREYNTVHGIWKYMTVDDGSIDIENYSYLMIGTLESYAVIKKYFGADKLIPLYLEVEDGERLIRAVRREKMQSVPKYEELCRRFLADAEDFSEEKLKAEKIEHFFNNTDKNECLREISDYIKLVLKTDM